MNIRCLLQIFSTMIGGLIITLKNKNKFNNLIDILFMIINFQLKNQIIIRFDYMPTCCSTRVDRGQWGAGRRVIE